MKKALAAGIIGALALTGCAASDEEAEEPEALEAAHNAWTAMQSDYPETEAEFEMENITNGESDPKHVDMHISEDSEKMTLDSAKTMCYDFNTYVSSKKVTQIVIAQESSDLGLVPYDFCDID